jgi:hypothetical protein
VKVVCLERGSEKSHTISVAPDERDEFIAELLTRIEARSGRRLEVSEENGT